MLLPPRAHPRTLGLRLAVGSNGKDFSTANINVLFGVLLDTEFDLADPPLLPEEQRYIGNERSFEFILARRNNIIVYEALRAASEYSCLENVCWIIRSLVLPRRR
jgi:hypothetical protein